MKNWLVLTIVAALLGIGAAELLISCGRPKGNYIPGNTVVINGKAYQFAKVEADDDERVWILLPVDSTTKVPSVMGYYVQDGKVRRLKEVIIVKP